MPGNGDNGECSLSKEVLFTKNPPAGKEETGCPHHVVWHNRPSLACFCFSAKIPVLGKGRGSSCAGKGFTAEERVPTLRTGGTHCQCSANSGWALLSGSPANFPQPHVIYCGYERSTRPVHGLL